MKNRRLYNMCGINGFNYSDTALIQAMNNITRHRGPDDNGVYADEHVTLGHNRLSIIDLSEKGHQPMSNEDGSIWITYNGEIYNFQGLREELLKKGHKFKSNTDTEVIIHAYEEYDLDFFNMLNGMWAFCIYDRNKRRFILGRDQFGIKPLYYYADKGRFIFSSMIGGILCHRVDTEPNDTAIMEYLAYNLEDHDTHTFFKNIYSLAHDSMLIYDLESGQCDIKKWYNPGLRAIKGKNDLRDLFIESVRLRTISDVPIGSCLSGGLDSSAIVCILDKYLKEPFYTFSFIAPGSPVDESRYIKEIGRVTNTKQFFTTIDSEMFLKDICDFIQCQEEPSTGLSIYVQYLVMRMAHEKGAKVLLDGQGSDEMFAGYVYYYSYYFYELLLKLKWYTLAKEMVMYLKNTKNLYPHSMLMFLLMPERMKYYVWKRSINTWVDHDYLNSLSKEKFDPRWRRMTLQEALSLTLFTTSIPEILRWEDKNSMRWSIETRPPFLDFILTESALAIPSDEKLQSGKRKVIFKEAIGDMIPDMISRRNDKIGFAAPADDFFRNDKIIEFCKSIIYSDSFKRRPYWKWARIEKLFNDHIRRKINIGDTIFKWINLEIWLRMYFPGISGDGCSPSTISVKSPAKRIALPVERIH